MPVTVEQRERVAIVTLDDPDRRNALSAPLVDDIVRAVDTLEADDGIGALVVTGAPPAFCAGADLSGLRSSATGDETSGPEQGVRAIYEGFLRVARCTLPTVAAVNGPAVGAGLNLALACDVRIAAESARFDSRFVVLGLHPGGGATWLLDRALGPQGAAALGLFGEPVGGRRAAEIGLAWACVPDAEVVDGAVELARRASEAPRELVRKIKASLRAAPGIQTHDEAVDAEIAPQLWSMTQPEFLERVAALAQRISKTGREG